MLQYILPAKHNSAWKCLVILSIGLAVLMLSITGCSSTGDVDSNGDYERLSKQVAQLQSEIDELRDEIRSTTSLADHTHTDNRVHTHEEFREFKYMMSNQSRYNHTHYSR